MRDTCIPPRGRLGLSNNDEAVTRQSSKWDGISFSAFSQVLSQYRVGHLDDMDIWWLLGFDDEAIEPAAIVHRRFLLTKKTAHIWTGDDTACRMFSTGGLGSIRMPKIADDANGRKVCANCLRDSAHAR